MAITNTVINLDTTSAIVYKETNFPLTFSITHGFDDTTKSYTMTDDGVLGTGEVFSKEIDLSPWLDVDLLATVEIEPNEILNITGKYRVGYKYKITVQESGDIIKNYATDFLYGDSGNITVEIPFSEITTALNPYHLIVTVLQEDGSTVTSTKPILLADNAPTVVATMLGNTLYAQLGDVDSGDKVQYNVYLNGEKVFPYGTSEYSELISPTTVSFALPRDKVLMDVMNHVEVNVLDNWGLSGKGTNDFVGIYVGLMFCDETEQYYSDDIGVILKQLDMGILQAGKISSIQTVWIKNTYGYDVNNIVISVNTSTVPPLNIVYLDTSDTTFVGADSITLPNKLSFNEKAPFYLRILPDIESVGGGVFEITATATPVA